MAQRHRDSAHFAGQALAGYADGLMRHARAIEPPRGGLIRSFRGIRGYGMAART